TIVWTDMLQTSGMLLGLIICVVYILKSLHLGFSEGIHSMASQNYTRMFVWDPDSRLFFIKQILAGAFITITMTGMDQEMMQKNISVRTLKDSRKNVISFAFIQALVVLLFLFLGGLLYTYAQHNGAHYAHGATGASQFMVSGKNVKGDALFPEIALHQ